MADLADPNEKPALSPEGLLRALRVSIPGSGLSWESLARLVVLGADVSKAVPPPDLPRAATADTLVGGTVASAGCFEVEAGSAGCWAVIRTDAAAANSRARFSYYNSKSIAEAVDPLALPAPLDVPFVWTLGPPLRGTRVRSGGVALLGHTIPSGNAPWSNLFQMWDGFGWWLAPGQVLRVSGHVVNSIDVFWAEVAEPLAGP